MEEQIADILTIAKNIKIDTAENIVSQLEPYNKNTYYMIGIYKYISYTDNTKLIKEILTILLNNDERQYILEIYKTHSNYIIENNLVTTDNFAIEYYNYCFKINAELYYSDATFSKLYFMHSLNKDVSEIIYTILTNNYVNDEKILSTIVNRIVSKIMKSNLIVLNLSQLKKSTILLNYFKSRI